MRKSQAFHPLVLYNPLRECPLPIESERESGPCHMLWLFQYITDIEWQSDRAWGIVDVDVYIQRTQLAGTV
jgi:hypothetical protein